MKVGILTFHRSYNYGAFTQCFALQNRLKRDFPDVTFEVIDYVGKKQEAFYETQIEQCKSETRKKELIARNQAFLTCQRQLPLSDFSVCSDEMQAIAEQMNRTYDAVIVGSDAVWNWVTRGFPNIYFLKDYHGKKFSYAASVHGMNFENMTAEQTSYLHDALGDFTYIGTRDVTTERFVRACHDTVEIHHNCDPSMLLDFRDVPIDVAALKEKMIDRGVDFSRKVVGVMASASVGREIKKRFGKQIQLVAVYEPNDNADVYLNDLTPFEWMRSFSLFDVTLTHFFHGTMLSLKNETPVIPIEFLTAFSANHVTKIKDAVGRLHWQDFRCEADWRGVTKVQRVMKHLGLWEDRALWDAVSEKMNCCFETDYSGRIRESIEQEAQSYNSFRQALESTIKECTAMEETNNG